MNLQILFYKFYKGLKKYAGPTIEARFNNTHASELFQKVNGVPAMELITVDTTSNLYTAGAKYKAIIEAFDEDQSRYNMQLLYEAGYLNSLVYEINYLQTMILGYDCIGDAYSFLMEDMLTAYYLKADYFETIRNIVKYGFESKKCYEEIHDPEFFQFVEYFLKVEETGSWLDKSHEGKGYYFPYFNGERLNENALIELCDYHLLYTEKSENSSRDSDETVIFYAHGGLPIYPFEVLAYKRLVGEIEGECEFNIDHTLLKPFIHPSFKPEMTDDRIRPSIGPLIKAIQELETKLAELRG